MGFRETVRLQIAKAKAINKQIKGFIDEEQTLMLEYKDIQEYNKDKLN